MDYVKKITTDLIEKILSKGVRDMPQNPAAQGYDERQIRGFYYIPEKEILNVIMEIETTLAQVLADIKQKIETAMETTFVIVNELPDASLDTTRNIYLVQKDNSKMLNIYNEYITVEKDGLYLWEMIGSTEFNANYNDLKNIPIVNADLSVIVPIANTYYLHAGKTTENYTNRVIYFYNGAKFKAINGVSESGGTIVTVNGEEVETFDADTKVGFTDYASIEKAGVGKVANWAGIQMQGEIFAIYPASDNDINNKTAGYHPITPPKLDLAIKVGITTNTLTLTDGEKAVACEWLGALLKGTGTSVVLENGTTIQWHYGTTGNTLIRRLGNGSAQVKMADAPVDNDIANVGFVNQAVANAGGGATLYRHNVTLKGYQYDGEDSTDTAQYEIQISIISSKSTALTLSDVQSYCDEFHQPAFISGDYISTEGTLMASPAMPSTDALSFNYSRQDDVMETIWGRIISLQHCTVIRDNVNQI